MAYNSQQNGLPWHGLGTPNDGLMVAEEVLRLAGLDWEVQQQPMFLGDDSEIPTYRANVRMSDNKVLGVVGNRYNVLQNKDAFRFFDAVVDRDEAVYETAGSLSGGRKVWLLAKLPDHIRVGNTDDIIEKYVLLTNTHDGSKPVIAKITPVRVVCNNTLTLALNDKKHGEISVRHSTNMIHNLEIGAKTLGIVNKIYAEVGDIFNAMVNTKMSTTEGEEFVKNVMNLTVDKESQELVTRSLGTYNSIMELVEAGRGTELRNVKGTVWGYYNAVTEYVDHYRPLQAKTERMDAIVFGSGAQIKERAFAMASDLV